jgi:hypothetical protein
MPYPMPGMTFGDFLERAENVYGVTQRSLPDRQLVGPRGPEPIEWLEREVEGQVVQVVKPKLDDDEPIAPWLMGNLCRRLGLDAADFGYHLED